MLWEIMDLCSHFGSPVQQHFVFSALDLCLPPPISRFCLSRTPLPASVLRKLNYHALGFLDSGKVLRDLQQTTQQRDNSGLRDMNIRLPLLLSAVQVEEPT